MEFHGSYSRKLKVSVNKFVLNPPPCYAKGEREREKILFQKNCFCVYVCVRNKSLSFRENLVGIELYLRDSDLLKNTLIDLLMPHADPRVTMYEFPQSAREFPKLRKSTQIDERQRKKKRTEKDADERDSVI